MPRCRRPRAMTAGARRPNVRRPGCCMYPKPLFREILGRAAQPESVLVFAQHGAGKTTFRQEIERLCREQRPPVAGVLDVAYVDFGRPLALVNDQPERLTVAIHVEEIVRR